MISKCQQCKVVQYFPLWHRSLKLYLFFFNKQKWLYQVKKRVCWSNCQKKWYYLIFNELVISLTLSLQRLLSYRNQSIGLLCKSVDWFLYDRDFHHERVSVLMLFTVCNQPLAFHFFWWVQKLVNGFKKHWVWRLISVSFSYFYYDF